MLTQACLERTKTSFHFAFPIAKSWGFLSSFLFWKTVPLSTWDSPFLSVCIVLYFPIIVNAFLSNFYEFIWCSSPKIRPAPGAEAPVPAPAGEVRLGVPPPNPRDAGVRHRQIRRYKAGGRRGNHPHRQCLPPEIGAGTPTLALVKAGVQSLWPRPALWAESHPRPPAHFCLPFLRGKSRPPPAKPKTPYCFQVASSYQVLPVLAAPPQVVTIWARSAQLLYQNT